MRPWYRFCRALCQGAFLVLFRGRVYGRENVPLSGGVLLVCNHQSYLDPVLATLALPRECHYMARDTLFRNARFRRVIESLNAFPVKRGTADIGAIKETLRRLKNGALVTLFPEATRTRDGRLQPMQAGALLLARKARVPVVPTAILGAFEAWPRFSPLPLPRPIVILYGEALQPEHLQGASDEQLVELVRGRIAELMQRGAALPWMHGRLAARRAPGA